MVIPDGVDVGGRCRAVCRVSGEMAGRSRGPGEPRESLKTQLGVCNVHAAGGTPRKQPWSHH